MKALHLGGVPTYNNTHIFVAKHPGRWVLNHAIAQKKIGIDVEVVTVAHKAKKDFIETIERVKVHFLRTFHPYRHFTLFLIDQYRIANYIKKLNPDIVHAHGTEDSYALAAIRTKLPFVVTAQGLMFQIIPRLEHGPDLNIKFIKMSEHYAWKRIKFAIAKSEYVKEDLLKKYQNLNIRLIPNTYEPGLDSVLKSKNKLSLVFIGTINERKGVHLIADAVVEVVKHIPDVELHIVGNAEKNTMLAYEKGVLGKLENVLGPDLKLHGKIKSSEVFSVLDGCVALLAPSLEEMFGNQLIEGLMRGCHGIVTDNTALAENVRRFGNGTIVPQNDPDALANAILNTLRHPPSIMDMENAREKIRAYMAPEIVAEKHLDFYTEIVKGI